MLARLAEPCTSPSLGYRVPAMKSGRPSTAEFVMVRIATVVGGRSDPVDDNWEGVEAEIVVDDRFPVESLAGVEGFSHLDVVYVFDKVEPESIFMGARHPRNRSEWPLVGIFAQRAKARPNRIGVSTCRLLGVEGRVLRVSDLDAIDGSPVLDLKPHVEEMGPRGAVREPAWTRELMLHYWR
jgi:tRNA-Thr(GGU) m(6)t(6)A37 methyltransferase TsaA